MATPHPIDGPRDAESTRPGAAAPVLSTQGLARVCATHPWRVVAAWLVILAIAGFSATSLGDALTSEVTMTSKPDSITGLDLIEARLRPYEPVNETVIVRSADQTVDDQAFRLMVEQATQTLAGLNGVVASATNTYQLAEAGDPAAGSLISADRHTTIILVTMDGRLKDATKHGEAYVAAVEGLRQPGFEVFSVGDVSADRIYSVMAEEDLKRAESIGLPVALLVLVVVFGAVVAALVPIGLAAIAIALALGLTAFIGRWLGFPVFIMNVITMLGLAVGIDYSLFIIARMREERRRGLSPRLAIERAGGTASKAVLFSGSTVVLALAGMFFVPLTIFRAIGTATILVVISAVAATLTLIPAVLALLGDRIDWPRRHRYDRVETVVAEREQRGFWPTIARLVMARPWISAAGAVALLALLTIPALDLERGMATTSSMPPSDVRTAYEILGQEFNVGRLAPVEFVVDGRQDDAGVLAGIERLSAAITANPLFGQAPHVTWNTEGDLALIEAPMNADSTGTTSTNAIDRLRTETVPRAFGDRADQVYVTGMSAIMVDFFDEIDRVTPLVFAFVLGLSFVLLMLAFRSLVVPVISIFFNLLSVGAAYGLLVLVFQKGHGTELLGFQRTPQVEAWIPIFLFCILFGLSMDYHVFLLSRIREHYDLTGDNREAVAAGLRTTAKVITGAALIMVVVFAGFAAGRMLQLQEMGFGLAVAVFLDATVVRTLLVPSVMALLGDRNWYLPRWLEWLPDLRIEGNPEPAMDRWPAVSSPPAAPRLPAD